MWQAALSAILAVLLFAAGLYLGWMARDKVAIARNEEPMPLREVPLKDPIELPLFLPLTNESDSSER